MLTLAPGPTRTGLSTASGTSEDRVRFQQPDEVVAAALAALDQTRTAPSVVL